MAQKNQDRKKSYQIFYPDSDTSSSEDGNNNNDNSNVEPITDQRARQIESLWKNAFPGASLLPVIGLPSNSGGVGTLTHTVDGPLMRTDNLISKSPLSNNALYSFEVAKAAKTSKQKPCGDREYEDRYLNLYEIMIPDIPGAPGESSAAELYVQELAKNDLHVSGVHFHWWASSVFRNDKGVTAVHHQSSSLSPEEFSRRTIAVLQRVLAVVNERGIPYKS